MLKINKIIGIIVLIIGTILVSIFSLIVLKDKFYFTKSLNVYKNYNATNQEEIYGILKIDKINITNIIYDKESRKNNVNRNICLAYSDEKRIILASHSGNSYVSYFKNLDKLLLGDTYTFSIKNLVRTYELFKIKEVNKTGHVVIEDYNYPILVMITCSKKDNSKQVLYYARLVKSEISR